MSRGGAAIPADDRRGSIHDAPDPRACRSPPPLRSRHAIPRSGFAGSRPPLIILRPPPKARKTYPLTTPVAFLIFNRPDVTARVFEQIRAARPAKLLVVADGPRPSRPDEPAKCAETRRIIEGVDWPCEVLTNFSETNLGCKRRVSSGIDWVFSQVEEAIILEDDCLPHPTFFRYCSEMLERYRDDDRVFHIAGCHFRPTGQPNPYSYYFSRYSFIWGWASWRRAWKHYDVEMKLWPTIRDGGWLRDFLGDEAAAKSFTREFQRIYDGEVDTWDFQWGLACWINSGLSIRPRVNLISNIGFIPDATHTTDLDNPAANLETRPLEFPLQHPPFMMRNAYEDRFLQSHARERSVLERGIAKLKRIVRRAPAARAAAPGANGQNPSPNQSMLSVSEDHWLRRIVRTVRNVTNALLVPVRALIVSCTQTDKSRWRKVATKVPPWDERNQMIAALIPANSAVVDLGCGARTLKARLKPGCVYQPCDVVQSAPEVLLCDFNAGLYPALTRDYDYVVCSGVLEYMRDPMDFLTRISRYGSKILLSYNPAQDGETKISRLGKGWLNHMSQAEVEQLFRQAGLAYEVVLTREPHEITYELFTAGAAQNNRLAQPVAAGQSIT